MAKNAHMTVADKRANSSRELTRPNDIPAPFGLKLGFVGIALQLVLLGCGGSGESAGAPAAPPPPAVKIAHPLSRETTEWDEYTGRVEAINSVDIRARVGGYLESVNFTAGAKVKKGDLLFQIDPKPLKAQLNYAVAELERAKTKRELAKNDLSRAENLFKAKAISAEEYDMRNKGLREAAAAVESAEANVYTAKLNLEYTEIRAPINGRVGREMVTAGNLVKVDDTLLTNIVSTDPVYVYVDADEQSVLRYRRHAQQHGTGSADLKGTPVELAVADETDFPHQGKLDYIAPREDAATGTLTLRGVFANPDELLSPGFFARLRVQASASYQALLLPDRAIATDQAQRFVWVINQDNQAEYRQVTPGSRIGDMRVIRSGLQADDWVVVEGLQKLKPGAKVDPERTSLTAPGAQ
ncbi:MULTISPECIES: efflux RND transporter periplasmic adaptor subunit [Methylomonas]|uniref:Efflux transporter periplasmic adaptor subunit n=2 Tax=Methylomonas TaxID=416 RepID=A0A140E697_9GAMM|nr:MULTISPECIES: efflux RND transporter periplasmic adaptor subunit [Methylomonas]AMK78921.1 efflux transporter periplasmic adaptor subunit [Methylomonas denitrificans]OAI01440.1 efflux transporter periplasmic adaptor subunit [Methylomonas methanica]TCV76851.1 multidrug efflux system membrane fusion protein [Methylomonas methanica]